MDSNIRSSELYVAAKQKAKEKEYWLNKLSGDINKAIFPYDYKKSEKNQPVTQTILFQLPGELSTRMIRLSNGSDFRTHILLVTAVTFLLSKYTGNRDIILGTPIFKNEIETQLINTVLTLRNRVGLEMTVKEFILQVSKTVFEASENQNYPLKLLLNQLEMSDFQEDFPLFDAAVLLENIHRPEDIRHIPLNMIFSFLKTGTQIRVNLEYNASLYRESSVRQMIDHLTRLMENAFFNLDLRLAEIDILAKEEREKLLNGLNAAAAAYPLDKTIHGLFAKQVEKTPGNIAVIGPDDVSLTYRQLNEKANQLARLLRERGVREDSIVGIISKRSANMVVGMMAAMKAGGAYLPISIGDPWTRNRFIIEDSGAVVLLVQKNLYEENKSIRQDFPQANIFLLDDETLYKRGAFNLEINGNSRQLAYVIYTSGTTGKPKGVMIQHSALINFIYTMYNNYNRDFGTRDNCLSLTNISFDVSVCEIFVPLVFGSSSVILPEEKLFDPHGLAVTIMEKKVTFAYIPPGLLKDTCTHLRNFRTAVVLDKMLVGVEPINDYILDEYRQLNPAMKIVNGYGPTEATICSTSYNFNLHTCRGMNVPIGKALDNMQVVLLDPGGELYPFGVPGELCVSGAGLARGYLNRPQLTAEKFVDSPFFPGERMYKTGDMARWQKHHKENGENGNTPYIQFLGRIDKQVKIRGNRIEPGEIENQLQEHKLVKKAVVIARESETIDKYLCAYLVYHHEVATAKIPPPPASQLIDFLSAVLPSYMIPMYFVPLEHIPLTSHGKLDIKALPDPLANSRAKQEFVAPSNEIEETIAGMWKEILKMDRVSINDNFFEIGGNSLSIVKLRNRLKEELRMDIPDVKLLEYPTIHSFHNYLSRDVLSQTNGNGEEEIEFYDVERVDRLRLRNEILDAEEDQDL